jgi:hypothetical protein
MRESRLDERKTDCCCELGLASQPFSHPVKPIQSLVAIGFRCPASPAAIRLEDLVNRMNLIEEQLQRHEAEIPICLEGRGAARSAVSELERTLKGSNSTGRRKNFFTVTGRFRGTCSEVYLFWRNQRDLGTQIRSLRAVCFTTKANCAR